MPRTPVPPLIGAAPLEVALETVPRELPGRLPGVLPVTAICPSDVAELDRLVALLDVRPPDAPLPTCPCDMPATLPVGGGIIGSGSSTSDLLCAGGASACTTAWKSSSLCPLSWILSNITLRRDSGFCS